MVGIPKGRFSSFLGLSIQILRAGLDFPQDLRKLICETPLVEA
jgi:hypothetical protein